MYDPISNRTVLWLADSAHILVPVVEVFQSLNAEGWMPWFTLESYTDLLTTDDRFELYEGLGDSELFHPMLQAELKAHGLLAGPLIMLKSRGANEHNLMMDILLHLQEMNHTLETAWQLRPSDNPAFEAEILGLLMMGDMMEREVQAALENGHMVFVLDPFPFHDEDSDVE